MEMHRLDTEELPPALEELDPSPIDETPSTFIPGSKDYFPPPQRSTTILGLSTQRIPYYLHQTQKYSSITFLAFTALHVTNTSLIPLATRSIPESTRYLLLTRPYYQSFPLEPLLVALPLALHIASGAVLRLHRRHVLVSKSGASTREEKARVHWPKFSGTSALGYAAAPLVLGHAFLNRGLPLWVEGSSAGIGLDYIGHAVASQPVAGSLGFLVLVAVVGTHTVWGMAKWLGYSGVGGGVGPEARLRRKKAWWGINVASSLFVAIWAAGGVGIVARGGRVPGWVGKAYDEMLHRVPFL